MTSPRARNTAPAPSRDVSAPDPAAPARGGALLWPCTILLLALGLVNALVSVEIQSYWESDPAVQPPPAVFMSVTPTLGTWLNLATVAAAGLAMLVHAWAGGRIKWGAVVLAFAGIAGCFFHGRFDGDALIRGSSWLGGVALALAIHHLASRDLHRRFMAAAIVALAVPLALQALHFIVIERPMTIRMFEANKAQIFAAHGWAPDSAMAQAFIRRMTSPDAVGVFSLSNVLGSIAAAAAALAAGFLAGAVARRDPRAVIMPAITLGLALTTMALSRSKGAAVAFVLVLGLVLVARPLARSRRWNLLSPAAAALVALAFVAILVRGWVGPPATVAGERSLLFRFHYLQGAARMIVEDPAGVLLRGLGSGGFVEAYFRAKNPINPEDVTSTHNLFADYAVMLGLGGLALSALALAWLWQAGRRAHAGFAVPDALDAAKTGAGRSGAEESGEDERPLVLQAAALGMPLFITQYFMQLPGLTMERGLTWIFSTMGFIAVVAVLASRRRDGRWINVGLLGAAALLLTHNQIEMTFFQPGSATLAWMILAVAAGPGSPASSMDADPTASRAAMRRIFTMVPGAALLLFLPAMVVFVCLPVTHEQQWLARASVLRQMNRTPEAIEALGRAASEVPRDFLPHRWFTVLSASEARELMRAGRADGAAAALGRAVRHLRGVLKLGINAGSVHRLMAQNETFLASITHDASHVDAALEQWREVLKRRPYSLPDHLAFADLLWEVNRREEAREVYRRCLELDAQAYLDPVRQLVPGERARVESSLGATSGKE